jgi:N utilization substance protein A
MEVIVDDSQLSLAIGKKGQNVRLAAKLLGWKIDIKSEEEKRQEVESQMAALVAPGAPVAVLIEYGLGENVVELLVVTGIGTIEKLGSMTPEELEEIQGIGPAMVEQIQESVNSYYSQFEDSAPAEESAELVEVEAVAVEETAETEPEAVPTESEAVPNEAEQSGRIEDAGSPTHNPSEGTASEGTGPEEGTQEGSGQ